MIHFWIGLSIGVLSALTVRLVAPQIGYVRWTLAALCLGFTIDLAATYLS